MSQNPPRSAAASTRLRSPRGRPVAPSPAAAGFRPAGAALAIAAAFLTPSTRVSAQATGAQVIHGQASMGQQGSTLVISTRNGAGTNHSAINWQSFSVPAGTVTQFNQPSATSMSINRVLGNDPSSIFGTLSSNGRLVLVNPSGITVGAGAVVDTASFTASTLQMSAADALSGRMRFGNDGAAGPLQALGRLLGRGGDVVLIAPEVEVGKSAVVEVTSGAAVLVAGQKVELTGRGLEGIRLAIQAPTDRAVNLGTLKGDAVGIFAGTLKHSGLIQASGATVRDGRVVLQGGAQVEISGSIAAASGGSGGQVHVTAEKVMLRSGAVIDVSGVHGGGEALVGGGWQGKDARVANATQTVVEAGARISADANESGNGGTVVVWSDQATRIHGAISARGGAQSGDGGLVETSSKGYLAISRSPDLSAPHGRGGTWLLDPFDITIAAVDFNTVDTDPGPNANYQGVLSVVGSTVAASTIAAVLNSGSNVIVDTSGTGGLEAGNITVSSAIAKTGGGNASLTLNAHNNINLNASITSSVGQLNLNLNADQDTNGSGAVNFATPAAVTLDANGGIISAVGKTVNVSAGTATINSAFSISSLNLSGGTLDGTGSITTTGPFNITGPSTITGSGVLTTKGTTTIDMVPANAFLSVNGKSWNNEGNLTVGGDDSIVFGYTAGGVSTLTNTATGTINLSSSHANPLSFYSGSATVNNAGTLNQIASGTHYISSFVTFNNTGAVNVHAGTLRLDHGGTDSGLYAVDAGTALNFASGTRDLNAGSNITGLGSLNVSGGIVNVNNLLDLSTTGTALNISAGTLNTNSALSVGTLNLSGGTLGGTGNLTTTGAFNITGNSTITGSGVLTTKGTTLINLAPANDFVALTGGKSWNNEGTLTVGGGTTSSSLAMPAAAPTR